MTLHELAAVSAALAATRSRSAKTRLLVDCLRSLAPDECETGAVCTNVSDALTCRKVCTDQTQCASTENCNGVSGTSTKSCQPK